MEDLFLKISSRIAENMPQISLIDEDCGQLIESEEGYPVTFPCALIDVGIVEWSQSSGGVRGRATIVIKLAVDCYEDTHYSAGTTDALHERLDMNHTLHRLLNGYCFGGGSSPMQLSQSKFYTLYGQKKVYESRFAVNVSEELTE